jgi:glutathione synthase/RimK-type ligase-like ATP-grasp enzyme/ribosomal protein S18 acetylase RimI-like enzyme
MSLIFQKSVLTDLELLEKIENACFADFQRSSRRAIRLSITSSFQGIWMACLQEGKKRIPVGMIVYNMYPKTLRIYSIAVLPEYQGNGYGKELLAHARQMAINKGYEKITLEALATNQQLIAFYEKEGFVQNELLPDYYIEGKDAMRMTLRVCEEHEKKPIGNIIVVDNPKKWKLNIEGLRIISAKSYLSDIEFQSVKNVRIFNLSNSYRYQSTGYYVSLLASAREHRAIPNVTTLRDFRNVSIIRTIASEIDELMQKTLEKYQLPQISINIYFGQTINNSFKLLGQKLYRLFETPLFQVQFQKTDRWIIQKVSPISLDKVIEQDWEQIQYFAQNYFSRKRFTRPRFQNFKYDLAILVNPNEKNPPSSAAALENFKKAARKIGFYTEFITKDDYDRLTEFDALFIRETTSVNDHTYHFSRTAYAEGLVVIDDPWSILRCSNKIFLNERLNQNNITMPKSWVLGKGITKPAIYKTLNYPLVLKQPDSAFSLGVTKVNNPEELEASVNQLFKKSDLVIAQEFLPSEFDWRIGILDQKPLYACKYYMAKDHWQIVDWNGKQGHRYGKVETVGIDMVPDSIIKAAVKSAALMGDGLYGVDLKLINKKAYVIEVNDNPNLDAGYEDAVLKEGLYLKIMQSIYNRIEMSRNMARFVSVEGH